MTEHYDDKWWRIDAFIRFVTSLLFVAACVWLIVTGPAASTRIAAAGVLPIALTMTVMFARRAQGR